MRVGNPFNILLSPFLRIRRLLSIHFLPALVRFPWIVVLSVVASFTTYSTTAMVPVSSSYHRFTIMRGVVCYCTACFAHSLISFLLSLAVALPFFARHCLFTQLRLCSHVRLAPHVYYPLMM